MGGDLYWEVCPKVADLAVGHGQICGPQAGRVLWGLGEKDQKTILFFRSKCNEVFLYTERYVKTKRKKKHNAICSFT